MPGDWFKGRRCAAALQAKRQAEREAGRGAARGAALLLAAGAALAGCRDPLGGPVDLYHNLEGGEIAAQRPPPPGAGLPYPLLGTTPAKPTLPDPAFRNGLQAQLAAERDRTERVAADSPVMPLVPPPPPALPVAPPPGPPAGPSPDGLDPVPTQPSVAAATLDTADAPPPKPTLERRTAPALTPQEQAIGPAPGTKLRVLGGAEDVSGAPDLPAMPPPPATFEGVAVEPAPSARILPAGLGGAPAGTQVFFADGSAVLPPNQIQALKDFLTHRRHQSIVVIGLGGAVSDTPDGQAAAIALGLKRGQAVAQTLAGLHVPPEAIRLQARAFGSGAVLQLSF